AGFQREYTINYIDLTISTSFNMNSIYGGPVTEYIGTRKAISSVVLPNGKSYHFSYDNYGYITEIDLPTGAVITYAWASDAVDRVRYVSSRTVTVNGQANTWTFVRGSGTTDECSPSPAGTTCRKITVTDPLQNQTVYLRNDLGDGNGTTGITRVRVFQGAATGTALREYTLGYQVDPDPGASMSLPTSIVTRLQNGLVSEKDFVYDSASFDYR